MIRAEAAVADARQSVFKPAVHRGGRICTYSCAAMMLDSQQEQEEKSSTLPQNDPQRGPPPPAGGSAPSAGCSSGDESLQRQRNNVEAEK